MITALAQYDPQIFELVRQESARESSVIRLIPSENYVSRAVMQASGSCLTNKYAEGYPGRRYYEGQQVTDLIERLAQERAKKIFKADHANVQPYSGSVANLAAYAALIEPGDMIMGMSLTDGGHLTHGWKVSLSSRFFKSISYPVNPETGRLDYDHIADLAKKHRPKIIISGATAYPREIDFEAFGRIAKDVGAYHVSDIEAPCHTPISSPAQPIRHFAGPAAGCCCAKPNMQKKWTGLFFRACRAGRTCIPLAQ
jgi:glycine hydroxymethyltransferase